MRTHRRRFGAVWRTATAVRVAAIAAAFVSAASVSLLSGCSKKEAAKAAAAAPANPKEKRFQITGEIVNVHAATNVLDVLHDEIKGYMPAMTMEFKVTPGDIANAKPGLKIKAEMVDPGDGEFRLEKIWPLDTAAIEKIEAAAKALTQETAILGKNAFREIGEKMPNFALYDQEGRVVESSRFRGKQLLINFIFTRCPIATMCPAATARFQLTQKAAREAGVANLELLSISLDPEYDTPGILKEYALQRSIDTSNFTFLTGPESAIKNLLAQFGVLSELQGTLIKHTLATILVDEAGKIAWRADGGNWDVQEFVRKMKK
jgi:protein SCO1